MTGHTRAELKGKSRLPLSMLSVRHQVRAIAERSSRYSQRHFRLIGAITVFTLPFGTFLESAVGDPSFNSVYIRSLAACAGIPFLLHDRLPAPLRRNLVWLWIGAVTFVLPFSFGAILTLNAALTEPGASPSPVWVYQYLIALFIFIQLIHHGPLAAVLWAFSSLAAFALCLAVDAPNVKALREVWLYPIPVYLTALIVGSITNRNLQVVQSEQLRAASAIGSNIAHELRTPLASIRSLARGIGRFLPDLADGYEKARSANMPVAAITPGQLQQLRSGLETIHSEVGYSNTIIDMLLLNTSDKPASADRFEEFRISEVIEEAVARFPFNNSTERRLVNYSCRVDFSVFAPRPLVVHVFFNLIKNALFFVQRHGDGTLELTADAWKGKGVVEVTDTGTGIPASLQPRIFDRFFSSDTSSQGAGIGLSFCKTVMESIGGAIQCTSQEGEYTTFRLVFPAVKEHDAYRHS